MNMDREFTIFENDNDARRLKRFQSMNADEWKTRFTEQNEKFRI